MNGHYMDVCFLMLNLCLQKQSDVLFYFQPHLNVVTIPNRMTSIILTWSSCHFLERKNIPGVKNFDFYVGNNCYHNTNVHEPETRDCIFDTTGPLMLS